MAVDKIQKFASNIGFDTFTKRWFEPYDISLPILVWLRCGAWLIDGCELKVGVVKVTAF